MISQVFQPGKRLGETCGHEPHYSLCLIADGTLVSVPNVHSGSHEVQHIRQSIVQSIWGTCGTH